VSDAAHAAVRWSSTAAELDGALRLREQVFCGEQGVSLEEERDGRDADALHAVALAPRSHAVIGTLRLLLDGEVAKIGRVAVARSWREQGIASRLLVLAVVEARASGARQARLAAQLDTRALYERAGFAVESEPFEEARIMHVWMGLEL
jgi:predicted GNAT family N-acyltransferase